MRHAGWIMWTVWYLFAAIAFTVNWHDGIIDFSGEYAGGKIAVWLILIAFLAYSHLCSRRENFFRAVKSVNGLWWGRQIGIDLYIGIFLFLGLIWLHSGSFLVMLAWMAPILVYANLATLIYLVIFYDDLATAIASLAG